MVADGTREWLRVARYEGNSRMQEPSFSRDGVFSSGYEVEDSTTVTGGTYPVQQLVCVIKPCYL